MLVYRDTSDLLASSFECSEKLVDAETFFEAVIEIQGRQNLSADKKSSCGLYICSKLAPKIGEVNYGPIGHWRGLPLRYVHSVEYILPQMSWNELLFSFKPERTISFVSSSGQPNPVLPDFSKFILGATMK